MVHPAEIVPWPEVSPRVRDLIRQAAEIALKPRADWIEELHRASLSGQRMRAISADPVLADGSRRANLANSLHWAGANLQHPGRRVPPNVGPEILDTARDLVRRGLNESALDAYRTGQGVAWRRWMEICFDVTTDPAELRELLDISSLSISTFIDDTIAAISERMEAERHELTRGTHAERRAAVTLLLEGAPIGRGRAEAQLGYGLAGPHVAAIFWGRPGIGPDALERAAEAVAEACDAGRRLTVIASAAALWIWLAVGSTPAAVPLARVLAADPEVRVALGRPGVDLDGFRRSHHEAVTAQQMLARLGSSQQFARYEDVYVVSLLTEDPARADAFVEDTLGALVHADTETRDTLATYVKEQCVTSRTAERLYTHRNTVLRRLARADELLPRPLGEHVVDVAVALEILKWRGTAGGS